VTPKPTDEQIKAVHEVLYDPKRLQAQSDLIRNIAVLMNLNPSAELSVNDVRNPAGSGPNWFETATGAIDSSVIEAAGDCRQLAATLTDTRAEISKLSIPDEDRKHLMAALAAEAESWTVRARIWTDPNPPKNPYTSAIAITQPLSAAANEAAQVTPYLKSYKEAKFL
jgi:hypothetical protein